jgi:methionyl-tRNA synthetase
LKPEDDAATAVKGQTDEMRSTGWLINPHCKVDGATPERRKTKHLYIRLDALREKIIDWFGPAGKDGAWTTNALAITQSWIDKGLQPRAISRDLRWGVPIPSVEGLSDEEYSRKVMYVWFDAPIGYISITKTYTDGDDTSGTKWEQWWKNPENVKLYQFMGKDNVQFHSIVFPASQLGTGEKWTKVHKISATEYLNYENGKFSKSKGVGIFGNNAKDTGIAADIWRFYLLSRRPENGDTEFKWEEFIDTNNNELLKNIGNLVQRTLKFCHAKMDGVVPESDYSSDVIDTFKTQAGELLTSYIEHLEGTRLRAGVMNILSLGALGNKFLQDNKLDNRLLAEEPARCKAVISTAISHIYLLANLIAPYMPDISRSIFEQLAVDPVAHIPETWDFGSIPAGHAIGTPKVLFTAIPVSKIEEWRLAYGGEELKRQKALQAEKAAAKKAKQLEAKEKKKQAKLAAAAAAAAVATTPSGEAKQAATAVPDVAGLSLEKN